MTSSITTAAERADASDACYELLLAAETAQRMVHRIWERWFAKQDDEWKEFNPCEMSEIGDQLDVISDTLFRAIVEVYLETGEAELFPGAKYRIERAQRHITYNKVSELIRRVEAIGRTLKGKASNEFEEKRRAAMRLPDDEAIAALTAILDEAEGKAQ